LARFAALGHGSIVRSGGIARDCAALGFVWQPRARGRPVAWQLRRHAGGRGRRDFARISAAVGFDRHFLRLGEKWLG
jgi:hypothetical protein